MPPIPSDGTGIGMPEHKKKAEKPDRQARRNPRSHDATAEAEYIPHIRRIGEEKLDQRGRKKQPARR